MEYSKFKQLIKGKERTHVDFKISCDAFLSKTVAPRAELAKDICAMANNGGVASYIIVGVSDDGKDFVSVSNPKLTEENVQSFCKTAVSPPPRIRVYRKRWPKASEKHKGKDFVIIQVGPNRRQAFRFARDFIAYNEKVCYRRNEVGFEEGAPVTSPRPRRLPV